MLEQVGTIPDSVDRFYIAWPCMALSSMTKLRYFSTAATEPTAAHLVLNFAEETLRVAWSSY